MYLDHFGLKRYPFRLSPDIDFLYMSRGHARAKAYLDYTVVSLDGFVVITGEIGAGKTTLLNKLVADSTADTVMIRIDQTQLTDVEFLQAVLAEVDHPVEGLGKVQLLKHLKQYLVQQAEAGNRVVLAVDEAQSLSRKVLEEIRLLSGVEYNKERLVSVILMGQPELERLVNSPDMEQLAQRIRLRFHLDALSSEETREYIRHRLTIAGAERENVFETEAFPAVDLFAGGIPRLINSLCDMALLTAFVDNRSSVTARTVEAAAGELGWEPYTARHGRSLSSGAEGIEPAGGEAASGIPVSQDQMESLVRALQSGNDGMRRDLRMIAKHLGELVEVLDQVRDRMSQSENGERPKRQKQTGG